MSADLAQALDALHSISPNIPRDEWVRVAMGAHAAGLDFEAFDGWSATGETYDARSARDTWKSIKPGGIGAGTLFAVAKQHGWKNGDGGAPATPQRQTPAAAPKPKPAPASKVVATYVYCDESCVPVFEVLRHEPKRFTQRRPDPNKPGAFIYNVDGVPAIPYRLPELSAADPGSTVYVTEGEKDCDRLASLGLIATTNARGAAAWKAEHARHLEGHHVVVLLDNDQPGRKRGEAVARTLQGIAASVKVLTLPGLPEKGDVSDWLDAGRTKDELLAVADAAPHWIEDRSAEDDTADQGVVYPEQAPSAKSLPHISEVKVWSDVVEAAQIPEELLLMPSDFLNHVCSLFDNAAEDTDKSLSIAGVIHLACVTVARRVRSDMDNRAALYLVVVARSGRGKNAPLKFSASVIVEALGIAPAGEFFSPSGLFSLLRSQPATAVHIDEYGDRLNNGLNDRSGSAKAAAFSTIKTIYSDVAFQHAASVYSLAGKSIKERTAFLAENKPVKEPHLNILGATTLGQLYAAITAAIVEGGLVNRHVLVAASGRIQHNEHFVPRPPSWLVEHVRAARGIDGGLASWEDPDEVPGQTIYSFCSQSREVLRAFKDEIAQLGERDEFMADMTSRWRENAMRMALALHAFGTPAERVIDPAITSWCVAYTRHFGMSFARTMLERATPRESYGRKRQEYLAALRKRPEGTTTNDIGKLAPFRHDPAKFRFELISDMVRFGDLAWVIGDKPPRGPAPRLLVALA